MTGYGFTGPMTARGTVFSDKALSATDWPLSEYLYKYRYILAIFGW